MRLAEKPKMEKPIVVKRNRATSEENKKALATRRKLEDIKQAKELEKEFEL